MGTSETRRSGLSTRECLFATLVLFLWLVLFTGGTLIDTRPYRYAISPEGVWAMDGELREPQSERYVPTGEVPGQVVSWLIVLGFFLPVNLALVCVMSGALGAFGSLANLQTDDEDWESRDTSSPYVSAMLRGFFVYLFLISGLLLLDANPFSDTSPGQYVRLAGFLSLMSFVVNYRPHVFGQLVAWSFQRIQARVQENERDSDAPIRRAQTTTEVVTVQTEVQTQAATSEVEVSAEVTTDSTKPAMPPPAANGLNGSARTAASPATPAAPTVESLPEAGPEASVVPQSDIQSAVTTNASATSVETVAVQSTVISETQTTTREVVVAAAEEKTTVKNTGD